MCVRARDTREPHGGNGVVVSHGSISGGQRVCVGGCVEDVDMHQMRRTRLEYAVDTDIDADVDVDMDKDIDADVDMDKDTDTDTDINMI